MNGTELPIAEEFLSIQGEGVWTGTLMYFIRLAGCSVGKYRSADKDKEDFPIVYDKDLPSLISGKHSVCTTASGEWFLCDTDYHSHSKVPMTEMLSRIQSFNAKHICITGGEPLLHEQLINTLICSAKQAITFHLETSGTIPLGRLKWLIGSSLWVTCSPKQGCIEGFKCNEWKFLYHPRESMEHFEETVERLAGKSSVPIFIQPINPINSVDNNALSACLGILNRHPEWRLSVQLHKFLQMR